MTTVEFFSLASWPGAFPTRSGSGSLDFSKAIGWAVCIDCRACIMAHVMEREMEMEMETSIERREFPSIRLSPFSPVLPFSLSLCLPLSLPLSPSLSLFQLSGVVRSKNVGVKTKAWRCSYGCPVPCPYPCML